MADGFICFHVHINESPGCISFSDIGGTKEDIRKKAEAAFEWAKDFGGVIVGPYDFDFESCPMWHGKSKEIPDEEIYCWPGYEGFQKKGMVRWHIHTHDDGHCQSFDTLHEADLVAERKEKEGKDVSVVGPLDFPATACSFYNSRHNNREKNR